MSRSGSPRFVGLAIVALLVAQIFALDAIGGSASDEISAPIVTSIEPPPPSPPGTTPSPSPEPEVVAPEETEAAVEPEASPTPADEPPRSQAAEATGDVVAPDPGSDDGTPPRSAPAATAQSSQSAAQDPARTAFERQFPAQAAARQDPAVPASTRWAVLVGVNEHTARARDNLTSRQDAEKLRRHLVSLGWRTENIVLLVDRQATGENILQAMAWLARKSDRDSVAVFHFSGHMRSWNHASGRPDVALWPTDNNFLNADVVAARLGEVRAGRMWVNIQACHAEALNVPGLRREGRVLTFSSRALEKSYEDPQRGLTVFGHYLLRLGMAEGRADADGDGDVTVAEAFAYAQPRAPQRTSRASHGPQNPVIYNDGPDGFSLAIPKPPPPPEPEEEQESGERRRCFVVVCP